MKLLVVHCHPVPESYSAALRDRVVTAARDAGHEVDLLDLYAEGFDPVMGADERRNYHTAGTNAEPIQEHLDRIRASNGIVFVFPTWWMGPPTILKGWLERVWVPYEAFAMSEKHFQMSAGFTHIRLIGVVTTLGAPWWYWTFIMGAPVRRLFLRGLTSCCRRRCTTFWHGLHSMDAVTAAQRSTFLEKVGRTVSQIR